MRLVACNFNGFTTRTKVVKRPQSQNRTRELSLGSENKEGSATDSYSLIQVLAVDQEFNEQIYNWMMITCFQMNSEEGLVSQLLGDGGGQKFFVDVLLLLDPEDLKACRQVDYIFSRQKYVQDVEALMMRVLRCAKPGPSSSKTRCGRALLE